MKAVITIEEMESLILKGSKSFVWGLGSSGEQVYRFFQEGPCRDKITGFCGNDSVSACQTKNGLPVYSFTKLWEEYSGKEITVILASMYEWDIYQQLADLNPEWNVCLGYNLNFGFPVGANYFLTYTKEWKRFLEKNPDAGTKLALVKNMLGGGDETSVYVFEQLIKIRDTADFHLFPKIYSNPNNQYFEDGIVSLSDDGVFIDGGGFKGETTFEFIKRVKENYQAVYIFEPSIVYYRETVKNISKKYKDKIDKQIFIKNLGLWDKAETLHFYTENGGNGGNHITEDGTELVKTVSLDGIFEKIPVSFIKMDIEGAEIKAILGGARTIKKYKPVMAVCLYHRPGDIYEIPLLLRELVPEYKFYLRHYTCNHLETVLYAVPG